jgi:hypothetical protein
MDWARLADGGVDVVGIGEHCHGDLVSWHWRIDAVRALAEAGRRVAVLCETFDFFVAPARQAGFRFARKGAQFVPFLMPFSDVRKEHMRACREVAKHATCFGVDVQQLDFGFSSSAGMSAPILGGVLARHAAAWHAASDSARRSGALRNALNGRIVAEMATALKAQGYTAVLYFAHNEHVARSCVHARERPAYRTDGHHIERRVTYRAVATLAPRTWHTWNLARSARVKRAKLGRMKPLRPGGVAVVAQGAGLDIGGYCTSDDFDVVLVDFREKRFT